MTEYYIIQNDNKVGPLRFDELQAYGVTPQTMVWREGMADWAPASRVAELAVLFQPREPQTPPYRQYAPGMQPQYGAPIPHTNWLPWAIVGTVLGCLCSCIGLVFGIIAIVKANNANNAYEMGDAVKGDRENSSAKTMTIISLVIAGLGAVCAVLFYIFYFAVALAAI